MAAPLPEFHQQFVSTVLAYLIPALVVSGLIGLFKRDVENWMVRKLRALFYGKPDRASEAAQNATLDAPPCCPECRRPMVTRTARKGENRGSRFLGCAAFPSCRGTRCDSVGA